MYGQYQNQDRRILCADYHCYTFHLEIYHARGRERLQGRTLLSNSKHVVEGLVLFRATAFCFSLLHEIFWEKVAVNNIPEWSNFNWKGFLINGCHSTTLEIWQLHYVCILIQTIQPISRDTDNNAAMYNCWWTEIFGFRPPTWRP